MGYVFFSIDKGTEVHVCAKFLRYLDTLGAMSKLSGDVVCGIGSYASELESCYRVNEQDFNDYIRHSEWIENQQCVLYVADNKATLLYPDKEPDYLGTFVEYSGQGVPKGDFTYMFNKYWIIE